MERDTLIYAGKILENAGFPGEKKLTKEKIELWFELLRDIPDDKFLVAIKKIVKTSKYFPTIAEIREVSLIEPGKIAEDAWLEVLSVKEEVCGTEKRPQFSSPAVKRVVDSLGGLDSIWGGGVEYESYYRKMFIKSYERYTAKERQHIMLGEPTQEEAAKLLDSMNLKIKGIE